jgi:hypothetical protein
LIPCNNESDYQRLGEIAASTFGLNSMIPKSLAVANKTARYLNPEEHKLMLPEI